MPDLNIKGSLKFVGYTQDTIIPGEDGGILVYEDGLLALGNVLGTVPQTEDLLEVVNSQDEELLKLGRIPVPVLRSVNGDSSYRVKDGQYGFFSNEEGLSTFAYLNLANVASPGLHKINFASTDTAINIDLTMPTLLALDGIVDPVESFGIDGIFASSLFVYSDDNAIIRTFNADLADNNNFSTGLSGTDIRFLAEDINSVFIAAREATDDDLYSIIRINRVDPENGSGIIASVKAGDGDTGTVVDLGKTINLNAQVAQDDTNLYYRTFLGDGGATPTRRRVSIVRLVKDADQSDPANIFINAEDGIADGWPDRRERSISSGHIVDDYMYIVLYASDAGLDQVGDVGLYRKNLDGQTMLEEVILSGLTDGLSYDPSLSIASGDILAVNNFSSDGIVFINLPLPNLLEQSNVTISRQGGSNFYVDTDRLFINDLGVINVESPGGGITILVSSPLRTLTDVVSLQVDVNGTVFFFHDDNGDIIESINITQGSRQDGAQITWDTILTNNLAAADNSLGVDIGDFNINFGEITIERAGRYLLTADLDIALTGSYTGNSEFLGVKLTRGTTIMYLRPLARVAHLNPSLSFDPDGVHQIQIQLYPYLEVNDVISINSVIKELENQLNEFTIDLLSHSNFKFQRLGDD